MLDDDKVRQQVSERYSQIATSNSVGCGCSQSGCCSQNSFSATSANKLGYSCEEMDSVPDGANMGLGCGNPMAIASLKEGEVALDLGSGGGFDCFIAAKRVGKTGQIIGVDMTPDMVMKARENAKKGNYDNVEFRLGEIEHLPVADNSVDVIISNCVINLSPNKPQVFKDSYRVLKQGGRLAISDIVTTSEIPDNIKHDIAKYTGCIAGASHVKTLESMLREAGFTDIKIDIKEESRKFIREWFPESGAEKFVVSANIEAKK
ncbi:MAG: arsenite methyltransferase [Desulfobacterales bacterium]|nr:arsenite methyltransferase [Desulfobacterales bacterium]